MSATAEQWEQRVGKLEHDMGVLMPEVHDIKEMVEDLQSRMGQVENKLDEHGSMLRKICKKLGVDT